MLINCLSPHPQHPQLILYLMLSDKFLLDIVLLLAISGVLCPVILGQGSEWLAYADLTQSSSMFYRDTG